jgi:hypothetical protein
MYSTVFFRNLFYGFFPFYLLFLCSGDLIGSEKEKLAWTTDLKPGDKVCLNDIGKGDLLVGHSDHSLEYWYRSPAGNQRPRRQLRPSVRKLLFRVLWPGVKVSGDPDEDGNWYSATLLVIKNGHETKKKNPKLIQRGENSLVLEDGRSWVESWQVLKFTRARLKKKPRFGHCYRQYEVY